MPPGIGYPMTDLNAPAAAPAAAPATEVTSTQMQQLADNLPPNVWEKIREHLATLPEDEREQWFKDFTAKHGAGRIDAQDAMTRADSLRVDQPGMIGETGGFKMAASPLAHIGAGMQNYQANKQYKQGQTDLASANQGMADQSAMAAKARLNLPNNQPPAGGGSRADIMRMMAMNPAMRNR